MDKKSCVILYLKKRRVQLREHSVTNLQTYVSWLWRSVIMPQYKSFKKHEVQFCEQSVTNLQKSMKDGYASPMTF